jgi:myosin heavy subunit
LQHSFDNLVQTNKRLNTTCRRNTILYQQNITRCSRKLKASINQTVIIQKTALEQQKNITQCHSDLETLLAQTISLQNNNTILEKEITALNKTIQNCSDIQSLSVNSRDTQDFSTKKKKNTLRSIADQLQWVVKNMKKQNVLLRKHNTEYQPYKPR